MDEDSEIQNFVSPPVTLVMQDSTDSLVSVKHVTTLDEFLDDCGFGKHQYIIGATTAVGCFADYAELLLIVFFNKPFER